MSRQALLRVDGGAVFTPAISQFGTGTQAVGTPAVDSSVTSDVYLTINSIPDKGGAWTFGVVVQPLVMWLWIGGALVVVGSVLSAIPGRRRRPTDPVSAPVVGAATPVGPDDGRAAVAGTATDRRTAGCRTAADPAAAAGVPDRREPVVAGEAP